MVTDPYDDDDDAPTLQRRSPASGSGPVAPPSGPAARFVSGFRAAYTPPGQSAEGDGESDFPVEADTAADGIPLAPLLGDDLIELIEDDGQSEIELAETVTALPADLEKDTVLLPVDVAALLQRASAKTDDDDDT